MTIKICTKCNRKKKPHLFPKTAVPSKVCKSCKRKEAARVRELKQIEDWHLWKARSLRSQWLSRASKVGADKSTVPKIPQIKDWLLTNEPYQCYFTGKPLNKDTMQIDHLIPLSRGGSFKITNAATTTKDINLLKAEMRSDEFKQLLELVRYWDDKGNSLFKMLRQSRSVWKK